MRAFSLRIIGLAALGGFAAGSATAGEPSDHAPAWSGELATGWDSLYMFRGANQLPGFEGYGSSLSWTSVSLSWSLTPDDTLAVGSWAAFGLGGTDYKEIDALVDYTHAWGDFSIGLGYALYAVLNEFGGLYANELHAAASYAFTVGSTAFTPSVQYAFNLGPAPENRGYVEPASSYLEIRLDAEHPLWRDRVALAPWVAMGVNFRSNTAEQAPETTAPFTGFNHVEIGLAVPVSVGPAMSVTPYVATSFAGQNFAGTRATTVWGGVAVAVSF